MQRTAESFDELKQDARANGFQAPVKLSVDPVSFRWNLHDDDRRRTCTTELT